LSTPSWKAVIWIHACPGRLTQAGVLEHIGSGSANKDVGSKAADQGVVAIAAVQAIVAGVARQNVVASKTGEGVVAAAPEEKVGIGGSGNGLVCAQAGVTERTLIGDGHGGYATGGAHHIAAGGGRLERHIEELAVLLDDITVDRDRQIHAGCVGRDHDAAAQFHVVRVCCGGCRQQA
jgi:hypothetical protein